MVSGLLGPGSLGGSLLVPGRTPPSLSLPSITISIVGKQGLRHRGARSGRVMGGQPCISGHHLRWADSEVSLPPTGMAAPEMSRAGGAAREGESTNMQTQAVGDGQVVMLKGK